MEVLDSADDAEIEKAFGFGSGGVDSAGCRIQHKDFFLKSQVGC